MGIQRDAQTGKWLGASIPWAPPLAVVLYQPRRTRLPATGAAACYFWARPFVENVMNEQLVVKNFGPIKDATVDFKRVTVFIGPTGGGKSTLAKLAAVFGNARFIMTSVSNREKYFADYSINNFFNSDTSFSWKNNQHHIETDSFLTFDIDKEKDERIQNASSKALEDIPNTFGISIAQKYEKEINDLVAAMHSKGELTNRPLSEAVVLGILSLIEHLEDSSPKYFPAERVFVAAVGYSWPGFLRDDIGLPKQLLSFANDFSAVRKNVSELHIPFLGITYVHQDGQDFIKIPESETLFRLYEAASGIQSVTPLLVLLEHLSRNTEQAQSFIIEEPELNLYPTAQRDLVYWLLEKCTQGENDLTITTHSPYVLSALNLALYASKVATLFPHQRQKVAKLIPEKYWLKAEEFSAYFVAKGGAKSIFDPKTGLLNESQLDEVSGEFADVFDRLTDLRIPEKKAPAKAKPARK